MAHKVLEDGRVVVDWTTGDPEGDRLVLLSAYRDFLIELEKVLATSYMVIDEADVKERKIRDIFKQWNISTENQVDEVPRIWIKRPE